tara:strand:+ start:2554 stop:3849 length:1296 start_codon:yes stop_codon:yes gene_type:complete
MGTKAVKQCRFYVDMYSYFHAVGYHNFFTDKDSRYLYLDAATPNISERLYNTDGFRRDYFFCGNSIEAQDLSGRFTSLPAFSVNAIGLFNHNLANNRASMHEQINLRYRDKITGRSRNFASDTLGQSIKCYNDINGRFDLQTGGITFIPDNNGWSMTHIKNDALDIDLEPMNIGPISYSYITEMNSSASDLDNSPAELHIGSWFVGRFWDTPHNPNTTLTMTREFDGISKQKSVSGKHFINIDYTSTEEWTQYHSFHHFVQTPNSPLTYDIPSMEFTKGNTYYLMDDGSDWEDGRPRTYYGANYNNYMAKTKMGKQGKRKWNLSFDHFSESDMWIANELSQDNSEELLTPSSFKDHPLGINDDSFQFVWSYTLGGNIPFIFCPNKEIIENTHYNETEIQENFAICIFDNKSLQVRQTAPNLYNISVVIREI